MAEIEKVRTIKDFGPWARPIGMAVCVGLFVVAVVQAPAMVGALAAIWLSSLVLLQVYDLRQTRLQKELVDELDRLRSQLQSLKGTA